MRLLANSYLQISNIRLGLLLLPRSTFFFFFFFNDTATTEIYTLSLHDALPISLGDHPLHPMLGAQMRGRGPLQRDGIAAGGVPPRERPLPGGEGQPVLLESFQRSEEHTSELQSQSNLVCRLLLEKKKKHTPLSTCEEHAGPLPSRSLLSVTARRASVTPRPPSVNDQQHTCASVISMTRSATVTSP